MTLKDRTLRTLAAVAIAAAVAVQIPLRGDVALGQGSPADICGDGGSKFLGIATKDAITAGLVGAIGYGLVSAAAEINRVKGTGGVADLLIAGDGNKPIYDVTAGKRDDFGTIKRLIDDAQMVRQLREEGPYTFFAPTNLALSRGMSADALSALRLAENKEKVTRLIQYHVVQGRYKIEDLRRLPDGTALRTLSGNMVTIGNTNGTLTINGVNIVQNDIAASNGWIHPIEAPLPMP